MPEVETDLELLRLAVCEAGVIARKYFGQSFKRWDKGPGNPVTEADLEIDRFLKARLRAARPEYGWLSEETEDNSARLSATRVFVVDPIDGTIAFVKGKPFFTICAAVVLRGEPVAGAVYNPITEECFTAQKGGGAFCNGRPIHVSACEAVEGCHMAGDRTKFTAEAGWPTMQVESRNSVAYRLALVAKGEFDAALAQSAKRDWDLAAADIIVREAGGKVTAQDGAPLVYNNPTAIQPSFVAAGPALHARLIAHLDQLARVR